MGTHLAKKKTETQLSKTKSYLMHIFTAAT